MQEEIGSELVGRRPSIAARSLIALVRAYQRTLSWLFRGQCRFRPSCSNYSLACLRRFGARRGSVLTLKRLARCHPFHPGGWDPPPEPAAPVTTLIPPSMRASNAPPGSTWA